MTHRYRPICRPSVYRILHDQHAKILIAPWSWQSMWTDLAELAQGAGFAPRSKPRSAKRWEGRRRLRAAATPHLPLVSSRPRQFLVTHRDRAHHIASVRAVMVLLCQNFLGARPQSREQREKPSDSHLRGPQSHTLGHTIKLGRVASPAHFFDELRLNLGRRGAPSRIHASDRTKSASAM